MPSLNCPVCVKGATNLWLPGNMSVTDFFSNTLAGRNKAEVQLPTYTCDNCGHGFIPFKIDGQILINWYKQGAADISYQAGEKARRLTAQRVLSTIARLSSRPEKVLDVGCGPGIFLDEARQQGCQVTGLEPSLWAVEYVNRRLKLSGVRHGQATEMATLPGQHYDVITAFDVIEHLIKPSDLIREAGRLLKPGGL